MRKQRDLQACISRIEEIHAQGGLEPEQKDALVNAVKTIKRLRRLPSADRQIVYRAVRRITEELVKAFIKHE
jgi:hypothetical protein